MIVSQLGLFCDGDKISYQGNLDIVNRIEGIVWQKLDCSLIGIVSSVRKDKTEFFSKDIEFKPFITKRNLKITHGYLLF